MLFLAVCLLLQATPSLQVESHTVLNSDGTKAFLEVLKTFRTWSLESRSAAPDDKPAASVSTIELLKKLGKHDDAAELVQKHGFAKIDDWQAYGDRLFGAMQQAQIRTVIADTQKRLTTATESERAGLKEHIASLEKAIAAVKLVRPLIEAEQQYITTNASMIARDLEQMPRNPQR